MSEGINQTNTLLNIRKRALELDIDDRSDSPEEEDKHTSEPENSSRKHRKTTNAPKRAKRTTQEGQSQTTKIVKDPTETGHTSDVEVIQISASGPDDTDRHQFCPDDLVSLFAGDDFNLSDEDTSDNADLLTDIDSALSSATEKGKTAKKTLPDYKGLITQLVDSIALTGFVCKELSYRRRDMLCPLLHKDFQRACSRTNKIGKMLLGDDLPKTIQILSRQIGS
jgi:hypothetical protein